MNILVVTNMYPSEEKPVFGIFVKEQVESLQKLHPNYNVQVLSLCDGNFVYRYILSIFRLMKMVTIQKTDIIHVHFGLTFLPVLLAYPYFLIRNVKVVTTFHGSDVLGASKLVKTISYFAQKLSHAAIGVSKEIENKIRSRSKYNVYIPCGVSESFAQYIELGKYQRKPIVIFPSNPGRAEKNHALFEAIIKSVKEREPDLIFEIKTLNNMSRHEVARLFQIGACLVLTSKYEGSPQVIKEAVISGLSIVSTDVGDVGYLLKGQCNATVTDVFDELVNAVVKCIKTYDTYSNEYDESLQKNVMNNVACQKLQELYLLLVEKGKL